jgi:DNA-directed RNA polymerase sigma subunit (sigma70/sigma32)
MRSVQTALLSLQASLALTPASEIALRDVPARPDGKPRRIWSIQACEIDNAREATLSLNRSEFEECYGLLRDLDRSIDRLTWKHRGLAMKIACQYLSSVKLSKAHLYTEAQIGLHRAAKRWTTPNQVSFTVYAEWWIRAQVRRAVAKAEPSDVPLPNNVLLFSMG